MKHKSALKRILHYIAGYRFYLAASLILAVLTVALTLYAPVLTGDAIDYMIGIGQVDFEALTALLIRLGVVVHSRPSESDLLQRQCDVAGLHRLRAP